MLVNIHTLGNYKMHDLFLVKHIRVLPTLLCLKRDLRKFQNGNYTIFKAFDHVVKRDPKKTLIYFEDFKMTTEEVKQCSCTSCLKVVRSTRF